MTQIRITEAREKADSKIIVTIEAHSIEETADACGARAAPIGPLAIEVIGALDTGAAAMLLDGVSPTFGAAAMLLVGALTGAADRNLPGFEEGDGVGAVKLEGNIRLLICTTDM